MRSLALPLTGTPLGGKTADWLRAEVNRLRWRLDRMGRAIQRELEGRGNRARLRLALDYDPGNQAGNQPKGGRA